MHFKLYIKRIEHNFVRKRNNIKIQRVRDMVCLSPVVLYWYNFIVIRTLSLQYNNMAVVIVVGPYTDSNQLQMELKDDDPKDLSDAVVYNSKIVSKGEFETPDLNKHFKHEFDP